MHDILFTFRNTHQALKAEKYLKPKLTVKLIPTPFEIFSECGFSLSLSMDENMLDEICNDKLWDFEECYMIYQKDGKKQYEKI